MRIFILIQASDTGDVRRLAEELGRIPGMRRVDVVGGGYDIVAELDDRSLGSRAIVLRSEIQRLEGVHRFLPLRADPRPDGIP